MKPNVAAFFDDATNTISYLVSDPETRAAAIIDPVLDFEPDAARLHTGGVDRILAQASAQELTINWVLETHAHADHLTAAKVIAEKTGAKIGIGTKITEVQQEFTPLFGLQASECGAQVFDQLFEDGDEFSIGMLNVRVIHTPGHTPACVSYVIGDCVFVGDTLFMPDYGTARADFPGGDAALLYQSIQKILALPGDTRLFVGHDYLPTNRSEYQWETTVGDQRLHNIHVGGGAEQEAFVEMRESRDQTLGVPKLILPSLQINIRGGNLPSAEDNGVRYIKLPINQLA